MRHRLDITIDESGDFGAFQKHSPYYLVAMLFHEHKHDITDASLLLDNQLKNLGHQPHSIHTGPLIRREGIYLNLSIDERKRILNALIHFCRRVNVRYAVLRVEKKNCVNTAELSAMILKRIAIFFETHRSYFQSFDELVVHYDNGQTELTRIIKQSLNILSTNVSLLRVNPTEHKLFQLIDMFCSLELTSHKFTTNTASRSEVEMFHNQREFSKDYLKKIRKKRLE